MSVSVLKPLSFFNNHLWGMATIAAFSYSSLPPINVGEKNDYCSFNAFTYFYKGEFVSNLFFLPLVFQAWDSCLDIYFLLWLPFGHTDFCFKSGVCGHFPERLCSHILSIVMLVCIPCKTPFPCTVQFFLQES